jgi:hypothetical protein
MTAEVGIMNTLGIALAADSAVTFGVGKTLRFPILYPLPAFLTMWRSFPSLYYKWDQY